MPPKPVPAGVAEELSRRWLEGDSIARLAAEYAYDAFDVENVIREDIDDRISWAQQQGPPRSRH